MVDLSGKRVLVTGASSGLGAALALGLAERGAVVGLCARRADRLDDVLGRVREHSPDSRAWPVDLGDLAGLDAFAERVVSDLGGLDLLINNAGIPKRRWAWHHRPDEVADVLRIDLESPIRLTLALLPALEAAAGHVVFIGSVAARLGPPAESVYAAAKAGITAFAEGLRVDLGVAGSSVTVGVVQPGVLATDLFELPDNDPSISDVEPLDPTEIVGAVLESLDSGTTETFVPSWFRDLPPVKTGDLDGFLQGAVEYTGARLADLGLQPPAPPAPRRCPMTLHPLSLLSPDEVTAAREVLVAAGELPDGAVVCHIVLVEPTKEELAAWSPDQPVRRRVRALILPGPELTMVELVVSLADRAVEDRRLVEGMRPALQMGESFLAILACKDHPEYQAALARRGITDLDLVQIDPWPAGSFGYGVEEGRRIARCISFLRETEDDNGYARPIEGVIVHVDLGRAEVLEVIDHAPPGTDPIPLAPQAGRYTAEHNGPLRTDLRTLSITQPDGPSFTVEDNLVRWQKWSLRLGWDPYEGLILHQVTYDDDAGGEVRTRSILHRASISEMVVPYGDPGEVQGWKNAFDAGEWGLGRMTQSLTLGCDCLGVIHYVDVTMANEQGNPWVVPNGICMHEEDYGINWKHVDLNTGHHEVRRSRRMVISHIATVGNYEYGFFWYLYLDGNIQLEVKLTGILSTQGVRVGEGTPFSNPIAPGLAAPVHQHLFCARLDLDVDGTENRVEEVEAEVMPAGPENPWGNAFRPKVTVLGRESEAQREVDASVSRTWRVVNPNVINHVERPVGYKLIPTMATPTLLARPESSIAQRAGFARHNLWVTPYRPDEMRAAGEFPNQHDGGAGLPEWTAADRDLVDTDVVLWYTFGITHLPRPEDWPVMPVEYTGFLLSPFGFFERNPALDVPPSPPGACHADGDDHCC